MSFSEGERREQQIRVLVCDDHDLIRQALRTVISRERDMEVVAEASDGEQAIALARNLEPDVVVMDIQLPGISGVEATRCIKKSLPRVTILALTVHDDYEYILQILDAGATGYLTKGVISSEIPSAIRSALNGEAILSEDILKKLLAYALRSQTQDRASSPSPDLTSRELEILQLAARGHSNKVISRQLNLSENTVKKYMMSVFDKLGVHSRTAAVIAAQRSGLISSELLPGERRGSG